MWYGAVGRSWKADRNTVNVNPNIRKKRVVKRGAGSFTARRPASPFP